MTPGPNELKAALQRLIDGNAGEADRDVVRTALNDGVLVTGARAVAIGGDASDVIITTDDQNIVFSLKGADEATVMTAINSIAPTRVHKAPLPPAGFTGREDDASLSLNYELLSEALRERWRWLAVFPDTFAGDAAAAVWEVGVDQAQDVLGELMSTSLVEWNETSGRYRLHDLVQNVASSTVFSPPRVRCSIR